MPAIPLSIGHLLEAVRGQRSREQMHWELDELPNIPAHYKQALRRTREQPADAPNPDKWRGDAVARWEGCKHPVAYGVIYCYAKHQGVSTSSLYVAARLYAHLRDAANLDGAAKKNEIDGANNRLKRLHDMTQAFGQIVADFDAAGYAEGLRGEETSALIERRAAIIHKLLSAYAGKPGTDECERLFVSFRPQR
jgi:hypothetical protein